MFLSRLKTGYLSTLRRLSSRARRRLSNYRFFAYLAILGPGIIAANAGNDAGGIATYSSAGAAYGYTLLWTFIPMTISLIVVQEMCMRMGVVAGQGLADLIRENFGVRWTAFVMLALLTANTGVVISEFVGSRPKGFQFAHDVGVLGGHVVVFADVGGQVVELGTAAVLVELPLVGFDRGP